MSFKTHTEGGSWDGGGTEVPNCNLAERNAITTAFSFMQTNGCPCVQRLGGMDTLVACLQGKSTTSVELDCRGSNCGSNFGVTTGNSVDMCDPALPPNGLQQDTDVTVFHECIHTCGGLEIDSWSLENHCYRGHGTFDPDGSVDFLGETSDVGGGLRAGTFVVWERATGRVFVKVSSGGSWDSGPTVTRGTELNVNHAAYIR